ncbi:hypothetical protein [Parasitella parasitica]|uniref:Tc1-like transposase DDE domain-containing protein n=1 Tax=Parasitella parasitica TaxID=35722 RepID=A0A0B7N8L2_9FUNG|nr:hypothetical protein [Parasitella parasitica]
MNIFHEDGRGNITDESGKEAPAFLVDPSFRLTNLTNLRKYIKNAKVVAEIEPPIDTVMSDAPAKKERTTVYNTYSDEDRKRYFFFIQQKLMTPSEAAAAANVNYETARKWVTEYNKDPEKKIPTKKTNRTINRPPSQLNENHKAYLTDFYDENPTATIQDAVNKLTEDFEGLTIKKSRVAEFMKKECNLSLKVVSRHPVARNSETTLQLRKEFVEEWIKKKGMLYMQNCVFLDESGFDVNMRRTRGWSKQGTQAVVETPSARGASHTIIGAISAFGVVNVSVRDPGNTRKRRVVGATKRKAVGDTAPTIPKGTTSGHYIQFISDTMDIMDEFPNMKGTHIVMDNAPIHSPQLIDPFIIERGYIPVYLPPYSPELNPIEMFWKVLKDRVKRTALTTAETLNSRIIEGSEDVPVEHLQNFIQHSIDCFPKCLNKEPL